MKPVQEWISEMLIQIDEWNTGGKSEISLEGEGVWDVSSKRWDEKETDGWGDGPELQRYQG